MMQESSTFLSSFVFLLACIPGMTGQNPCPDPGDISPCTCDGTSADFVTVDCSDATSGDQIFSAFNDVDWPFKNLGNFALWGNRAVEDMPEGMFGEVSFRSIGISNTSIKTIHPSSLLPSKDRLELLTVTRNPMEDFPWEALTHFARLGELRFWENAFTTLRPFESSSLGEVDLTANQIKTLEAGSFAPNLFRLILGFPTNAYINLIANDIGNISEESFRPIVEVLSLGGGSIGLAGNPVVCDCSMAWLALNPGFLESVSGRCVDGTLFSDLVPEDFQDCVIFDQ
ncbi:unnamed protein product [Darwinula stevensoni]|uniref:Oplophorus-luciferin 2-monooxygenase non-catalytic subunit n=1 Tax=Darwinula stevensoni TaxID=69355 RepID=A0A7R9A907_9CRUS|nr:unnamed protein product [Darwinula stevensoni]CAG0896957.1 unnamed protein product [Darwinula stevensoni]